MNPSQSQVRRKREGKRSREIFKRAEQVLVGGVNSPVRAFRSVGGEPFIVDHGRGQFLYDADGNELLDYVCSWGAMLLGHAHPAVTAAISKQAERGTSFGATTELEIELATLITSAVPFIEKIRFVSSGTEATMSALRLARGVTKRDLLVKFEGNYHGHSDSFLSQSGSGLATLGIAECPGVPEALAALTLNAPYNDLNAVERLFAQHNNKIAAIIVEPAAANMGVVLPEPGFLAGLREISRRNGALLIVDEVITGFRVGLAGAQGRSVTALLEARGVRKAFADFVAVAGVDLAIPEGGITAVIGPNGAGKTTLINLLSGKLVPDAGRVLLGGADVTRLPPSARVRAAMSVCTSERDQKCAS